MMMPGQGMPYPSMNPMMVQMQMAGMQGMQQMPSQMTQHMLSQMQSIPPSLAGFPPGADPLHAAHAAAEAHMHDLQMMRRMSHAHLHSMDGTFYE